MYSYSSFLLRCWQVCPKIFFVTSHFDWPLFSTLMKFRSISIIFVLKFSANCGFKKTNILVWKEIFWISFAKCLFFTVVRSQIIGRCFWQVLITSHHLLLNPSWDAPYSPTKNWKQTLNDIDLSITISPFSFHFGDRAPMPIILKRVYVGLGWPA